jgi:hypothetical protein
MALLSRRAGRRVVRAVAALDRTVLAKAAERADRPVMAEVPQEMAIGRELGHLEILEEQEARGARMAEAAEEELEARTGRVALAKMAEQ